MPFPTVTYTFANSTTADATQVNQNFTDLINGISDGTKNISVSAMTAAGATNLQAAVTLGASSANDLTFNGSIASTIPVKTNTSYDIGSATLGMRSVYIGGSSTFTVRVLAGTMASSYSLTLPTTTGTTGQFPVTDGTGVLSFRYPDKVLAGQTSNVTLTGSETLVPCDSSAGNFTVTLPAAASFTGKRYIVIKTDADTNLANKVTIAANGAELISGSNTTTLNTRYESIEIVCDGTGWHIINRRIPSNWAAFTPTGSWITNTTYTGMWRRVGDLIEIQSSLSLAGAPTSANLTMNVVSGVTVNTSKLSGTPTTNDRCFGIGSGLHAAGSSGPLYALYNDATSVLMVYGSSALAAMAVVTQAAPFTWANSDKIHMVYSFPVTGWNG